FYVFEAFDWDLFFSEQDSEFRSIVQPRIYGSDKEMKCLSYSKKNAKIAGVEKYIRFNRIDVEWLDTKFEEHELTKIVTNPPFIGKSADEKIVRKLYDEFFHQADFVLEKKGKIIMIARSFDLLVECATKNNFVVEKSILVNNGDEELRFVMFKKKI
ncbi:MAG: methyltransferase, partial [Candidatus Woesearchaeota archaeon]